jgi:hypothetical protein
MQKERRTEYGLRVENGYLPLIQRKIMIISIQRTTAHDYGSDLPFFLVFDFEGEANV